MENTDEKTTQPLPKFTGQVPSIGRIVHFYASKQGAKPEAAMIVDVHEDCCVNLKVFGAEGEDRFVPGVIDDHRVIGVDGDSSFWAWPQRV